MVATISWAWLATCQPSASLCVCRSHLLLTTHVLVADVTQGCLALLPYAYYFPVWLLWQLLNPFIWAFFTARFPLTSEILPTLQCTDRRSKTFHFSRSCCPLCKSEVLVKYQIQGFKKTLNVNHGVYILITWQGTLSLLANYSRLFPSSLWLAQGWACDTKLIKILSGLLCRAKCRTMHFPWAS